MTFDKPTFERSFCEALKHGKFLRVAFVLAVVGAVFTWLWLWAWTLLFTWMAQ